MAKIREPKAKEPVWYLESKSQISAQSEEVPGSLPFLPQHSYLPECSAKSREEGEGRHIIRLSHSPVIGGKGSGQSHLA